MTAIHSAYDKSDSATQMPSVYLFFSLAFSWELWLQQKSDVSTYMYSDPNNQLPEGFRSARSPVVPELPDGPRPQCLAGSKPTQERKNELRESQSKLCKKSLILIRDLSQLVWLWHYKHLSTFIMCLWNMMPELVSPRNSVFLTRSTL